MFFTDNVAAAATMRDGVSDSPERDRFLAHRTAWLVEARVSTEIVARIISRNNLWADMGYGFVRRRPGRRKPGGDARLACVLGSCAEGLV